ncbi:MAG: LysM peptidoglycan-binding domain-containing protein [Actinomycetota bacterium]
MTRTRVRWGRVFALVTCAFVVLGLGGRALGGSSEPAGERTRPRISVEAGETLWSIAKARIGPEGDPRPYIDEIRELNRMPTSELTVGQLLLLPTREP